MSSAMLEALAARERAPEIAEEQDIYACLLGSWTADVRDYLIDGRVLTGRGEWHFARALEGRAIQDVWIVPSRDARNATTPRLGNRYGTSIRVFDAASGLWRLVWLNPATGAEDRLVGYRRGEELVHEGERPDGELIRWRFTKITAESFRWLGEARRPEAGEWHLEAEFLAQRQDERGG